MDLDLDLERTAGIEPASAAWKTAVLPLDDARIDFFRAARGNCTRRLLRTGQAPRYLGLSSVIGGVGRDRAGCLLGANQTLSRVSYDPRVRRIPPPSARPLAYRPPAGTRPGDT